MEEDASCSQFGGGCNGGSTGVAQLGARAWSYVAVACSKSLVEFYLDVKTAFAAMARSLVIPMGQSDAAFFDKLTGLGFTD
eukprot:12416227-Karenia_brevis.AAC.1